MYRPGQYLGFTNMLVSAKTAILSDFISPSRCWQKAVIFLTHPDNLHKKAQWTKSRQLFCSNDSSCIFIYKHRRWIIKHTLASQTKQNI